MDHTERDIASHEGLQEETQGLHHGGISSETLVTVKKAKKVQDTEGTAIIRMKTSSGSQGGDVPPGSLEPPVGSLPWRIMMARIPVSTDAETLDLSINSSLHNTQEKQSGKKHRAARDEDAPQATVSITAHYGAASAEGVWRCPGGDELSSRGSVVYVNESWWAGTSHGRLGAPVRGRPDALADEMFCSNYGAIHLR
ncbi:hypothetical protein EYF80_028009 [Liparis tanakae]|uniref:Uncharacterized protein n=1 Tax=Liparis tanakae TaxID=230148 RepID=A0A4Z2H792_9TELE|nr:hypothetical protein EYF80_028009 [Liparis tanakae]